MTLSGFQLDDVDAQMVELNVCYIMDARSVTVQEECTVVPGSPIASLEYRILEGDFGNNSQITVTCDGPSQAKVSSVERHDGYSAITVGFDPPLEPDEDTVLNCMCIIVTPEQPRYLRRRAGKTNVDTLNLVVYFDHERPPAECWRAEWTDDASDAVITGEWAETIHRQPTDLPEVTLHSAEMTLTEVPANKTVGFRW